MDPLRTDGQVCALTARSAPRTSSHEVEFIPAGECKCVRRRHRPISQLSTTVTTSKLQRQSTTTWSSRNISIHFYVSNCKLFFFFFFSALKTEMACRSVLVLDRHQGFNIRHNKDGAAEDGEGKVLILERKRHLVANSDARSTWRPKIEDAAPNSFIVP